MPHEPRAFSLVFADVQESNSYIQEKQVRSDNGSQSFNLLVNYSYLVVVSQRGKRFGYLLECDILLLKSCQNHRLCMVT